MHLDDRLQALADFVPVKSRVADIGTDHGYLAVALIKQGKSDFVVAGDLNRGPYEAAKRTVHEHAISEDVVSVRIGDGLAVLQPGEVDTVCIAGMGGILMNTILEAQPEVTEQLTTLVLQPMNGAPELREWLYDHAWHIVDENLVIDDGRIYEIIKAEKGVRKKPSGLDLLVGPKLWKKKPPLLRHHIEALLFQQRRILSGMEKSERAKGDRRYGVIKRRVKALEERLKW
ncbi:tRNA (adenine(22)-N(1))-methyltransferase [Selenomonas ruminantium]|uniref:tRNA (Adenine22-N1)-methyltransferase n=1 Tax=Selenomonas ruminantium TaxID=971 RepID=A0A1H0MWP1_SELRU|nr:class I SAM-dependent methyltransferase [Selenomonas ruminantium]SDO84888.1 tRNA (adenine22-N1)-methyltransferase [Selenomonas ruminantium]